MSKNDMWPEINASKTTQHKPNTIGLGEYSDEDLLAELEMRQLNKSKWRGKSLSEMDRNELNKALQEQANLYRDLLTQNMKETYHD